MEHNAVFERLFSTVKFPSKDNPQEQQSYYRYERSPVRFMTWMFAVAAAGFALGYGIDIATRGVERMARWRSAVRKENVTVCKPRERAAVALLFQMLLNVVVLFVAIRIFRHPFVDLLGATMPGVLFLTAFYATQTSLGDNAVAVFEGDTDGCTLEDNVTPNPDVAAPTEQRAACVSITVVFLVGMVVLTVLIASGAYDGAKDAVRVAKASAVDNVAAPQMARTFTETAAGMTASVRGLRNTVRNSVRTGFGSIRPLTSNPPRQPASLLPAPVPQSTFSMSNPMPLTTQRTGPTRQLRVTPAASPPPSPSSSIASP